MDQKAATRHTYDTHAAEFERRFQEQFERVKDAADMFVAQVPGPKVLDAGAGPGIQGRYLSDRGLDVLCVDISAEMVARCVDKGLRAEVMDLECLTLPPASFDGVWAYASLLHVRKDRAAAVAESLIRLLVPSGVLGLAVKEGAGERLERDERLGGAVRSFSYFSDTEIRELFAACELLGATRSTTGGQVFLNYLFRKR